MSQDPIVIVSIARTPMGGMQGFLSPFSASQLGSDIDVGELIAICLSENNRRLAPYDARLKRPRFVPAMARIALKFVGKKKAA